MDTKNGFLITVRDRIYISWENSTELVRNYQAYAHELEETNPKISELFAKYAEDEAFHAARFHELLCELDEKMKPGKRE